MADTLSTKYRGLAVPIIKKPGGYFEVSYTMDIIKSALTLLLTTRRGERVMEPEYGSGLYDLVFEPNDAILQSFAYTEVVETIERWEGDRILILSVDFDIQDHLLSIRIAYRIREIDTDDLLLLNFSRRQ